MKKDHRKIKTLLLAFALVLSTVLFGGCGKTAASVSSVSPEVQAKASFTAEKTSAGTKDAGVAEQKKEASVTVSIEKKSGWDTHSQYDISITNSSKNPIKDWAISITVPAGTTVESSWNCNHEINGTTLKLTAAADWNNTVEAGQTAQIGGMITESASADIWDDYSVSYRTVSGATETVTGKSSENSAVHDNGDHGSGIGNDPGSGSDPGSGAGNSGNGNDPGNSGSGNSSGNTGTETASGNLVGEGFKLTRERSVLTPSATEASISPLSVKDGRLVNSEGRAIRLQGVSTHGLAWYPMYVNKGTFQYFRDDWGANVIRLAMYTQEYGGYCSGGNRDELVALLDKGIAAAGELGMYVIVDWHILSDGNPQMHKDEAIEFFDYITKKYSKYSNIIWEICNEPNGSNWDNQIKPYAEAVIPVIRANDPDSVVIVGTNTWSQDVDQALRNPLSFENIMYAFHFYAGTHKDNLRKRVNDCTAAGLPIFITECSITDASGNGSCDIASADQWKNVIEQNGLSFIEWSISNKAESSAIFKPECTKTEGGYTEADLNESARWYRSVMRSFAGK